MSESSRAAIVAEVNSAAVRLQLDRVHEVRDAHIPEIAFVAGVSAPGGLAPAIVDRGGAIAPAGIAPAIIAGGGLR